MAARNIRVIEVREEFLGELFYVAQALEADIKGIGTTIEEAREKFAARLDAIVRRTPPGRDPLAGLPPASQRFWDMYDDYVEQGGTMEARYW